MASYSMDGSLQSMLTSRESIEGLQNQLLCTYMELEYIRKASKAQAKLNDAKLQNLQEMLDTTKKERDQAIQECEKLQEHLFHLLTDPQQLEYVAQSACPTYTSRRAMCVCPSSDYALQKSMDTIPEAQNPQSMHALSEAQHTLGLEACECSSTINTPEQYDLTFLTEEKALQENASFKDSQEQSSMDIFSENAAFNQLESLDLTELQVEENLITNWEADLTKSWEASLSSSSLATSTTACHNETHASASIQTSTTPSSEISADREKDSFSADASTMASQQPIVASSTSPSMIAMSSYAPVARMSMQSCVSPWMPSISPSQPASVSPFMSNEWPMSAELLPSIPSMSASQSLSPIVNMSNHSLISAKLSPPKSSMSASQSASPLANICKHLSMSLPSITSMSAVSPIPSMSNQFSTSMKPLPSTLSMSASQSVLPTANMYSHMSMSAKPSPCIQSMSASQSLSPSADKANHLSTLAEVSPSTPASQPASPIATMSNHLYRPAKPSATITPLPALLHSSAIDIPSWGMPSSQSAAISASHNPYMTRQLIALLSTSSPGIPPLTSSSVACNVTPLPHHLTGLPPQATARGKKGNQVLPQKRRHLPEPPEAKMEVMLSSLPEKGKLLEAVMQAGPLLQQLLLAGPLPQWQRPPPQLNTTEIPRVPTSPNSVLSPFSHVQQSLPSSCIHPTQLPFTCTEKRFAPCNLPSMPCMHTPSSSSSKCRRLASSWV